MSKYFSVTLRPTLPVATIIQSNKTDLPFGAQDVMWDWFAFDVPKGACRLVSATILVRGEDGAPQTDRDMQLFFAKSDADATAPTSLGDGNTSVSGYGYYNNLLGHLVFDITTFSIGLDYMGLATFTSGREGTTPNGGLVLQGEPNSGTNVGYDKLYCGGVGGASNDFDFSTGVLADGAVTAGASTDITVKTVDARKCFAPGDIICVHDSDTAIGTVASVPDATSILLESANGVAIADEDEIVNVRPITVILGFER
tara:strand:+ start:204 stop:971 length:768 start_codon:yes stop_codon:yes gene_type:complete